MSDFVRKVLLLFCDFPLIPKGFINIHANENDIISVYDHGH